MEESPSTRDGQPRVFEQRGIPEISRRVEIQPIRGRHVTPNVGGGTRLRREPISVRIMPSEFSPGFCNSIHWCDALANANFAVLGPNNFDTMPTTFPAYAVDLATKKTFSASDAWNFAYTASRNANVYGLRAARALVDETKSCVDFGGNNWLATHGSGCTACGRRLAAWLTTVRLAVLLSKQASICG